MNQDYARPHRSALGSARSRRNAISHPLTHALSLATIVLLLSGCGTTVFQSVFNSNTLGAPPSPTQLNRQHPGWRGSNQCPDRRPAAELDRQLGADPAHGAAAIGLDDDVHLLQISR